MTPTTTITILRRHSLPEGACLRAEQRPEDPPDGARLPVPLQAAGPLPEGMAPTGTPEDARLFRETGTGSVKTAPAAP